MREVVNGVIYVLSTRLSVARYMPKGLPPRSTVNGYSYLWGWNGTLEKIHHALYVKCREQAAREASPTASIMDSQSVKSAEKGGRRSTRMASTPQADEGQETPHPGRQARLLLHALVTAADVQDRDGGVLLLSTLFGQFTFLRKLFSDSAYAGPVFADHLPCHAQPGDRDRQTPRQCQRLHRRASTLDVERLSAGSIDVVALQGLGEPQPQPARLPSGEDSFRPGRPCSVAVSWRNATC
jgi:hypothetical protein